MRITHDLIVALRLKLKSIGVPLLGAANIYCDNAGVVKNTSVPESTLSKKHNAINYHIVRESADTHTNVADPLMKLMAYIQTSSDCLDH